MSKEPREPNEMFKLLSENQLLLLVHCLHKSHDLAKRFNSNINQREILWKHGFLQVFYLFIEAFLAHCFIC